MRLPATISLGIASYLLFLLLNLPAQQVLGWVSGSGSEIPLTFDRPSGTIWSGEAEKAIYQRMPLGKIKWRFKPASLLLGRLSYEIELTEAGQKVTGTAQARLGGGYWLEEVQGLILAESIPQMIGQKQFSIRGKVDMNDVSISYDDGRLNRTEGQVRWLDATIESPLNLKVGDLQADLTTDDNGTIAAEIKDLKGATAIKAEARLSIDGNFQIDGTVKPSSRTDPGLNSALGVIGRKKPDGSFQLKYSGRI
ncbi:MAG: type II secretion system protein N [Candidatus Thiodiazotropha sp. (ex Notomyrtea botanica)]|nr:type II secretion system protein N [Candidatus Thiodiazotropha sp. (ex Notomyrtea botanica)]